MRVTSKVTLDIKTLRSLKEGLKRAGNAEIQIGILGQKNARNTGGSTGNNTGEPMDNADIGALHEFGSKKANIPARSFLRMPTETKLPKEIKRLGPGTIAKNILARGAHETLREIGQIAEGEIDKAFATSGYGEWPANSPRTIARKKGGTSPLIDTGKLRRAISSRVVPKGAKR